MGRFQLGINLWSQASDWTRFLAAGKRAESLGYDHLWTWDHLLAIFGDPGQPIFEGYTALAALAQATERIRLGLFVGANTFRNPGIVAKAITTIDHISAGRAILGIGGAWFELEHRAFGIDFGAGFGERLDWLGEAVPAVRSLLDGDEVSSPPGGRYAFDRLRIAPAAGRSGAIRRRSSERSAARSRSEARNERPSVSAAASWSTTGRRSRTSRTTRRSGPAPRSRSRGG